MIDSDTTIDIARPVNQFNAESKIKDINALKGLLANAGFIFILLFIIKEILTFLVFMLILLNVSF